MALSESAKSRGPARVGRALGLGERPAFTGYALAILLLTGILGADLALSRAWQPRALSSIAFWLVLSAISNLLPVPAGRNVYFSMSSPVNIAIAYLFPPPLAAAIVFVASVSAWELRRETTLLRALFNRGQLALSTAMAAMVLAIEAEPIPRLIMVGLAILIYHLANLAFMGLAEITARRRPAAFVARDWFRPSAAAAVSYFSLGSMGVVFALVYERIGGWAVIVLMTPLLVVRYGLEVARKLEQAERDRRALADRLVDERGREQLRIAGDMHNVVLQDMAGLQLQADNISSALKAGDVTGASQLAEQVGRQAGEVIADLRAVIANLRRGAIGDDGLVPTLERLARSFHAETGIEMAVSFDGLDGDQIPRPVEILLYECCQEAVTNVAKHAEASRVDLALTKDGDNLALIIRDDGRGMNPQVEHPGRGIDLARQKVALSGGGLSIRSHRGQGTEVRVDVPTRREPWRP